LFRKLGEGDWQTVEGRVERIFSHRVWEDPNPDTSAQLKINAAEQVREFLNRNGLTVHWVLGGEGR
jgi:DNA primase